MKACISTDTYINLLLSFILILIFFSFSTIIPNIKILKYFIVDVNANLNVNVYRSLLNSKSSTNESACKSRHSNLYGFIVHSLLFCCSFFNPSLFYLYSNFFFLNNNNYAIRYVVIFYIIIIITLYMYIH